jgi:RNA polymerase sigma-70 factor (ECF subfamily)
VHSVTLNIMALAGADGAWSGATPTVARAKDRTLDDELSALLQRARRGDDAAFAAWVKAVTPTLFRLAQRLAGDAARADDLVQDAVIRAWRALPTLRETQASRAWACRILRNAAIDDVRKAARRRETSLEAFRDADGGYPMARQLLADTRPADDVFAAAEARAFVRAVLDTLPEHHRLTLWLHDIDGLTQEEIAAALDVPLGTVASRLARARGNLDKKLRSLASASRWRLW